jgi:hypothetical protein
LLLFTGLVLGPVLVAVIGLGLTWWLPLAALGGAGLTFLALARTAAGRDARDPSWAVWRCASCEARVPAGAVVCPRCSSLDVGDPRARRRRGGPAPRHEAVRAWAAPAQDDGANGEGEEEAAREGAGVWALGAVGARLARFGRTAGGAGTAYVRFLTSGMSLDPDDAADMRWWAAAMLLLAAGFGFLAVAGHSHAWAPALAVFGALVAGSAAVALAGPRAGAEGEGEGEGVQEAPRGSPPR